MTKHTKGPWETFDNGTDTAGIVRYVENSPYNDGRDSVIICLFKEDGLIPTELAAQEANARLIAAAPELLEALELCLEAIQPYYDSDDDGSMEAAASNAALAAINKAKGE